MDEEDALHTLLLSFDACARGCRGRETVPLNGPPPISERGGGFLTVSPQLRGPRPAFQASRDRCSIEVVAAAWKVKPRPRRCAVGIRSGIIPSGVTATDFDTLVISRDALLRALSATT